MTRYLLFVLLAIPFTVSAVVIRSDIDDAKYRIPASAFPALADMPREGHGVLIAPQWVVTAAHAAPMQGMEATVTIGGEARKVKCVFTHPGYAKLPNKLVKEALTSGNASKIHSFLALSDDIALIKLASPVKDITPISLYRGSEEVGMTVQITGKGATGSGIYGEIQHGSHRTVLRRAFNVIAGANERYLWYRFDAPIAGLPLEGVSGSGDSGGPLTTEDNGKKQLVGLVSWSRAPGNVLVAGLYGQIEYNVRISRYTKWIESVMSSHASTQACTEES